MGRDPQMPGACDDDPSAAADAGALAPQRASFAGWIERILWGANPADEAGSAQHSGDAPQLPPAEAQRRRDRVKARRRRDLFSVGRAFFSFGSGGDGSDD